MLTHVKMLEMHLKQLKVCITWEYVNDMFLFFLRDEKRIDVTASFEFAASGSRTKEMKKEGI